MKLATYDLSGKRATGEIIRRNVLTIVVRTPDGNIIKRNLKKHNVVEVSE
jgi:hypothetical protein